MRYRQMPKSKDLISNLAFGCMRFPTDADGKIDKERSLEMLKYAYDHGVNYFDTAYPYHGGESETFLGEFLTTIDRSSVFVATKLPSWLIKTHEDMERYLDEQLAKLQTGYIDYYLLHSLNAKTWQVLRDNKVFTFLEKAKADGKIRHIGFSFHDSYPVFKKILNAYDWDFCQVMLNYLDTHYQAGLHGVKTAAEKGLGIMAMEPLRGGKLIAPIPPGIEEKWNKHKNYEKPVERALRWVWDLPETTTLLSGMSTLEQVKENVRLAGKYAPKSLSDKEIKLYKEIRREYIKRIPILCSECRYCLPCPYNVAIPTVMGVYNEAVMFGDKQRHKREYHWFVREENRADKCVQCGVCLSKCPQKLEIPTHMQTITDYFRDEQEKQ